MLTFNLKKKWFEKIKSGEKTHEYRIMSPYWEKRIYNAIKNDKNFSLQCCFKYREKILIADIISISRNINGQKTDLKINAFVFDIKFELIKYKH